MARLEGLNPKFYDRYGQEYPVLDVRFQYEARPQVGTVVIGSTEYRYKPGWSMHYEQQSPAAYCGHLYLAWKVPDSYHPESTTQVQSYVPINLHQPVTEQVYEALRTAEMHELNEFFVVDGHRPFDPHRSAL